MEDIIRLDGLHKRFRAIEALKGVSLAIPAGITYGLIGPNGSGKTTLMRILVGISRPSAGTARVLGRIMPDREAAQAIGYLTQLEALYQDLTVEENLDFFARVYGLSGPARRLRIQEVLELVELAPRRAGLVAELSGGMRRRLSLACALVHQPKLLVLDEPTVGVDPELRIQFWDYFERLTRAGASIIVSTHHLDEAGRCDRLGLMREGELLIEGAPDELRGQAHAATLEDTFLHFARRRSA
jgi:ABC-2 type transport system ATP-binding protein